MMNSTKVEGEKSRSRAVESQSAGNRTAEGEKSPVMITRREHDKLRRRAVAFERENRRFVLLIPCDGGKGWYEMGDRSALLYKYEVCDKIGVEVIIKDDYDTFFNQFDAGRIRTQHITTVRDNLKRAKMYRKETERDHCVIFELAKTYTEKEIEAIAEIEKRQQAQQNEIVKVKVIDPVIMTKIIELSARLHRLCLRKMDKVSRDTNGRRIVAQCDEIIINYYRMSGKQNLDLSGTLAEWQKLREGVHSLMIEMQLIVDLKIWKRTQIVSMGEDIAKMEDRINAHIRKITERIAHDKKNGAGGSKSRSKENGSARSKKVVADSTNGSF